MSERVVFVGRKKEIDAFSSAVNSLKDRGQVMLVAGAAGYGKSTLLKEFERLCKEDEKITKNGKVIVIRDEFSRSDDPLSFFSRVKEAWLRDVSPKSMKIIGGVKKYRTYLEGTIDAIATGASLVFPAGALISSMKMGLPSITELPQNMGFLLQAFVSDLAEFNNDNPDKRLVLLFDEYHKISNENIFNPIFDDIIENLPQIKNVMLVLAMRKLELETDIKPLDIKLFKDYETESFLKGNLGIEDKRLIDKAQRLLHGHPYSLGQLLRISKERETNIEEVIKNLPDTEVDDYLHKQFFDRLPNNVQRFLRKVCVLQILEEKACKFVIGTEDYDETDCSDILVQLQKSMVLDELGKVKRLKLYRLHDLFRDFLMAMNEASLSELHLKAAGYYKNKIKKRLEEGIDITDVRFALYHLQESKDINAFVDLLNEHEEGFRTLGYIKELFIYFNSISFEKITEINIKSATLHNYGLTLYLLGMYREALDKYNQSLNIREKLGDLRGIAGTLHNIASIHQDKGEYEEALDKYNRSLDIREKLGNQKGIAETLHNIAMIHQVKGEYKEALDKYNQSLDINEKLGNQMGIAGILNNTANIHMIKGEYEPALDKYNQSLDINEKLGNQMGIAAAFHQIATIHLDKGEYKEALDKYNQSLGIEEKLGNQKGIALTLHQIANIHMIKGEYEEALDKYNQSLDINEKLGDQRGIAYTMAQIGLLYSNIGEIEKAIEFTQKALNIFEEIGLENDAKKAKAQIESIHKSS